MVYNRKEDKSYLGFILMFIYIIFTFSIMIYNRKEDKSYLYHIYIFYYDI